MTTHYSRVYRLITLLGIQPSSCFPQERYQSQNHFTSSIVLSLEKNSYSTPIKTCQTDFSVACYSSSSVHVTVRVTQLQPLPFPFKHVTILRPPLAGAAICFRKFLFLSFKTSYVIYIWMPLNLPPISWLPSETLIHPTSIYLDIVPRDTFFLDRRGHTAPIFITKMESFSYRDTEQTITSLIQ